MENYSYTRDFKEIMCQPCVQMLKQAAWRYHVSNEWSAWIVYVGLLNKFLCSKGGILAPKS